MPVAVDLGTRRAERRIRSAAVKTTHQAIAFDAIGRLKGVDAAAWRRVFLRYGHALAMGAQAPDTDFCDFTNHLLFPADGGRGGAAERAQAWYRKLAAALGAHDWRNAVYCAGVLGHYLADPQHPFHTGQSAAENDIHYAVDAAFWSSYPALAAADVGDDAAAPPVLHASGNFLPRALAAGAEAAHRDYDALIAHFDLQRAVKHPASGLDDVGERILRNTLERATALLAAVFDRAIAEAACRPPSVTLVFVATRGWLATPFAAFGRRARAGRMRRTVRRMAREHAATGSVGSLLAREERAKRDAYETEGVGQPPSTPHISVERPSSIGLSDIDRSPEHELIGERIEPDHSRRMIELARRSSGGGYIPPDIDLTPRITAGLSAFTPRFSIDNVKSGHVGALSQAAAATLAPTQSSGLSNFRDRRSEPRVRGPLADPATLPDLPLSRQRPALALPLPGLTRADARLLAAAGFQTAASIAAVDVETFCAQLLQFALTSSGHQLLRDQPPPDIEQMQKWAKEALASQAA